MYTMKEVCEQVNISYETLRFYCREGLVPDIKRDKHNYRQFDEHNITWIKGLQCLRKCGMSIKDMKLYMDYCLEGESTISIRKQMLTATKDALLKKYDEMKESLDFLDQKQVYYDAILERRKTTNSHKKGDR